MKTQICAEKLQKEVAKIFIGKDDRIRLIMMSVFLGGHVLLDDLPGTGKTTLVKTMARALGCDFRRIQFTPDLLPSDIIGMTIFDRNSGKFIQVKGPVFTNILLADEINRAIPRTQAALLEAMEEQQVTIDNDSFPLPEPFFVMATQNPVERESTFQLPAAQMDRFFIRISLGFPNLQEETQMLSELGDQIDFTVVEPISSPTELMEIRSEIRNVFVSDDLKQYIVSLVQATRDHPFLRAGASPRASKSLFQGGKCFAAMNGRDYVVPEDIQQIMIPVLSHRITMTNEAKYTKKTEADILEEIVKSTTVPPVGEKMFIHEQGK